MYWYHGEVQYLTFSLLDIQVVTHKITPNNVYIFWNSLVNADFILLLNFIKMYSIKKFGLLFMHEDILLTEFIVPHIIVNRYNLDLKLNLHTLNCKSMSLMFDLWIVVTELHKKYHISKRKREIRTQQMLPDDFRKNPHDLFFLLECCIHIIYKIIEVKLTSKTSPRALQLLK